MKKLIGDNFCEIPKYKLYRKVGEIIHPTISKKNISNYKVIFDDKLLPVLVFYPKKVSNIDSVIIYVTGDGKVSGSYAKYADVCKKIAMECNKLVIAIDYFSGSIKYPTTINKVYKILKYLYEELPTNGIVRDNITLMGDSTGCKILGGVVSRLCNNNIYFDKMIFFYPVVRNDYSDYGWDQKCLTVNYGLDKKVERYLKSFFSKSEAFDCDLLLSEGLSDFPKTLIVTGDMDILKGDGKLLAERFIDEIFGSKYCNVDFVGHGFLNSADEGIGKTIYNEINEFVI